MRRQFSAGIRPQLDAMIAFGWQYEGELSTRVFACIPVE